METVREMRKLPKEEWPFMSQIETVCLDVWKSCEYTAYLLQQRIDGNTRLTVHRNEKCGEDFKDGITWDELQRIKNECLGEQVWCIEVYPAQDHLINVTNQRHLWVLDDPPVTRFPDESFIKDEDLQQFLSWFRVQVEGL